MIQVAGDAVALEASTGLCLPVRRYTQLAECGSLNQRAVGDEVWGKVEGSLVSLVGQCVTR